MNQKTALDILKTGRNVFLTGPAGSGKTYVLNLYINYLKEHSITPSITASTGIAATHIGGITIHSWSGMGVRENLDQLAFKKIARNSRFRTRMNKAKVLIIDEISMLHAHQLDMVDEICRHFKNPSLPFGGLQLILCGDFFQLPPVQKSSFERARFAFESRAWTGADMTICHLDEQHRQNDERMLDILNGMRRSEVEEYMWEILGERIDAELEHGAKPTRLYTHNADVDRINLLELQKIPQKPFGYRMQTEGHEKLVDFLKNGCLAPEELTLKVGAQVMFVKNNFDVGFVNGTTGMVVGFDDASKMPIVRTNQGATIVAAPEMWMIEEDDKILASVKQVPLRLAWAITVHKSQGMSLDSVEIDLTKAFEYGMGYVALSRARTLEGMRLLGLNEMSLLVNPAVMEFDQELIERSKQFEREFKEFAAADIQKQQNEFIGVRNEKKKDTRKDSPEDNKKEKEKSDYFAEIRKTHAQAYMPWTEEADQKLTELFEQGKRVSELAVIFERNPGAIRSRLKKLEENLGEK